MGDEDKKHDATQNKIDEERKKGNILKVTDAVVAAVLFVAANAIAWTAQITYQYVFKYLTETFETLPQYQTLTYIQALQQLLRAIVIVFITTGPFILLLVVTILIVLYAQVGWLITFKPLEPKYDKIDPIKGFKNKLNPFKIKQLYNVFKNFAVMAVIAFMVYSVLKDNMGAILQSLTLSPAGALALMSFLFIEVAKKVAMAFLVIAFLSYMFERWQFKKSLKMSDKEIRDEYKKLEGDPHIKAKQKQKGMEIAMGAAREAVPNADVVITNPTHYAVALEYKPKRGMKAPVVLAKGKNNMAMLIRQIAEENFIPIVEDPPTAQALFKQVKVNQAIPAELFVAVAKIIATIMKRRQKNSTAIPEAPPSLTGYAPVYIEPPPEPPGTEPPLPPRQEE